MSELGNRMNEAGLFTSLPVMLFLITSIVLFVKALLDKTRTYEKTISLLKSMSLFVIAWAFLGQTIGLITAFDTIESMGNIAPSVLAGGLKVTLLSAVFGLAAFIIMRIEIIALIYLKK